ncbi:hypothetical protein [Actinoplanes sp. NBRC 103695]|uniref:hypothetical protein n=1 Tax=Actinoplanes sp. NBRC 103695 TaxID=3032202 RepID=UPI0024A28067|nr:hypothetical protein [Actinoplanes sp. NBRC 103695]GLY99821.1 hypothetical protein Acsp02_70740 [Actinoplanes sp. NBRC 103695]
MRSESFLAFGYDVPIAAEDATRTLLDAARRQALMPDTDRPSSDLLGSTDAEDLAVHLAQIELHVQALRGRYDGHCIVASRLYSADVDDLQEIDRDDLAPGDDHQRLTWALTTLDLASLAEEQPRWRLGIGLQPSVLPM